MIKAKTWRILAIETSCDETAISIIEANGSSVRVLSNLIISQIDIHKPYGGVFPALAKREHAKNLIPMLAQSLKKSKIKTKKGEVKMSGIEKILEREPELLTAFNDFIPSAGIPEIDAIAFTQGPGLAPALWVGVNFSRALSLVWQKPIIPINHMEGHYFSALLQKKTSSVFNLAPGKNPSLALLISGGHTQIVLIKNLFHYKIVGETRDDAVGEAFDKVARVLGLPYPGGPEISKRAGAFRKNKKIPSGQYKLPRPMIHSGDFDFSFSGIKTAVLYMVQKIPNMTDDIHEEICYEFEEAVTDTLISKMISATEKYSPKHIILGGGVSANSHIQKSFLKKFKADFPDTKILLPSKMLTGDNALMIATAGYMRAVNDSKRLISQTSKKMFSLSADGNMKL